MKIQILLRSFVFCILLSLIFSCSRYLQPTAEVNYISSNDGTVTVRAVGIGLTTESAIENAEVNVFNVLFFRGLPESEQKTALIGTNETEEMASHKEYFNTFYKGKRYKTFIMSSIPTTNLVRHKGGEKSISVDVKVNLVALKNDLEQNNIIRKFGF